MMRTQFEDLRDHDDANDGDDWRRDPGYAGDFGPDIDTDAAVAANGGGRRSAHEPPPLRLLCPASLQGTPVPARRWLVPEWIPSGYVTGLYGAGGLGKSLIVQQLQTALAHSLQSSTRSETWSSIGP
jgi:hypothetical protein